MPLAFKRADFVKEFTRSGLSYAQAEEAYTAMISAMATAVASHRPVVLGNVAKLAPCNLPARQVTMGFKRVGGVVTKTRREFLLGPRLRYKFVLFRQFGQRHGLVP